jgi:hypothetical protein
MLHQVDDAFTARHVRYRAVPRTNRTPATSSRAYQSKSARVERAGIVMQSSQFDPVVFSQETLLENRSAAYHIHTARLQS